MLGIVGAGYHPHQPAELLELARLTLDAAPTDSHVEVVGSLRAGRTVFMTIALPDDIDVGGDVHMPRLGWVTSMDGTIATRAVSTYVRAVCANTIRASFRNARTSWSARHTSSLDGRTADAREALRLMFRTAETFRAEVEALTRQAITDHQVEQVLAGIWPDKPAATDRTRASAARRRDAVRSLYRDDSRVWLRNEASSRALVVGRSPVVVGHHRSNHSARVMRPSLGSTQWPWARSSSTKRA